MIRMIAALDDKLGIADDTGVPWDIPSDMRYFREKTINSTVVMGYKTYLELKKPLAQRHNLVIDDRNAGVREGFQAISNVHAYLRTAQEDVWNIGGAKLYGITLQYADELYLTHIEGDYGCTKFFPAFQGDFILKDKSETKTENGYKFYFARYVTK